MANKINLGGKHDIFILKKWMYVVFVFVRASLYLSVFCFISCKIYKEALHCTDCNNIVISFYCIIALACLVNIGVKFDNLNNIKIS